MKALLISILFSSTLSSVLHAQDYYHYIRFAEEAKAEGDTYGSVVYYEKAFALDSSDQALQYAYAEALEATHYYEQAIRLFIKVYTKGRGRFFPEGPAHIAQLKMYLADYEGAIKFWQRALRFAKEDLIESKRIEQRLLSCSYALSHPLPDDSVVVVNASEINTVESEYAADLIAEDQLVFSSLRGQYNAEMALREPATYRSRIYQSELDEYGLSDPILRTMDADSKSGHIGNACIDPSGDYLYFTQLDKEGTAVIKRIELDGGTGIAETLTRGINQVGNNNSQPFVYQEAGETFMLFSSDRPGGAGGFDLWRARISGSSDVSAEHLGYTINSPGNDVTPFYDVETATLYFSSDWHEGYGGYDIFSAQYSTSGDYSSPINSGLPINSPVNDLYYRSRSDLRMLTSNRRGSLSDKAEHCCNDIYFLEAPRAEAPPEVIYSELPESIEGVDELAGLLPITLYFHNDIPDPGSVSNSSETNYRSTVEDYLSMESKYVERYSEGLEGAVKDSVGLTMKNFFQDRVLAEYKELEGVARLILTQLEKGKEIEIAIKGYASPLAQNDYNRRLTQRRIASVRNYLYALDEGALRIYMRGEDPSLKIRPIPYGEEESEAFVSDNPADAQNSIYSIAAARERRVEILKISEME